MLDDNLTKKDLSTMIGAARFNTATDFKDFLKDKLKENFSIGDKRITDKLEEGRHDIYIMDHMTKRETIVVIGLKIVSSCPKISDEDIAKFHEACKAQQALYGVLMTESEARFFEYRKAGGEILIDEIDELEPLNYVDYEAEKIMDKRKLIDLMHAHKKLVLGIGLFVILVISVGLGQSATCKTAGLVLGNINDKGEKIFYLPEDSGYKSLVIGDVKGERRFCDRASAEGKGFVHVKEPKPKE